MGDDETKTELLDQRYPEFWDGEDARDALLLQIDACGPDGSIRGRSFLTLTEVAALIAPYGDIVLKETLPPLPVMQELGPEDE